MAKQLQLRRGTTAEHSTFTGVAGEITVDTTKDTIVVHDGVTAGGFPLARDSEKQDTLVSGTNIKTVGGETLLGTGDIVVTTSSPVGKSSMLSGSASVSNTTLIAGMSTTLYTGNGSTQSINAGVDLATQWGDTANETYGGLVWLKSRTIDAWNVLTDTVRGATKQVYTNTTSAEGIDATNLTSFTSSGFSVSNGTGTNGSGNNFASWIFQTTHRITGTTNHGKAYTCHYNPITGFTIVKYEGSGIAGHEIPHHLGRELGIHIIKNISYVVNWHTETNLVSDGYLQINTTVAKTSPKYNNDIEDKTILGTTSAGNRAGDTHILYGWANSYYDADNVLNGNYYTYVDQDGSGNQVLHLTVHSSTSRDEINWEMNKLINTTSDWNIIDYERGNTKELNANLSNAESTITANTLINKASPSQFNMASETSNIQLSNLVVSFTNGTDANGVVNTIKNLGSFTVAPTNGWQV